DPHGPAAASGLAAGDHLVTIDGTSLQGMLPQGAMTLIMNHHPGSAIVLGVERQVAPLRVIVQLRSMIASTSALLTGLRSVCSTAMSSIGSSFAPVIT